VLVPGEVRDRLTRYIFVSSDPNDATGALEAAFVKAVEAEAVEKKLNRAIREGRVQRVHGTDWFSEAVKLGIITAAEGEMLRELETLTARVIAVDHFDPAEVRPHFMTPGHNARAAHSAAAE
jgi:acyl-CoA dehydrogenase